MPPATTTDLTAANVLDRVASLMNDTAKTNYTYTAMLPYLNMATDELMEIFELYNIPVTNKSSAVIEVPAGSTAIIASEGSAPVYPLDLVEIQALYERLNGSTDPFIPVPQVEFLPHANDDITYTGITLWSWQEQKIKFNPPTTDREVKLDYVKRVLTEALTAESTIGIINVKSFLYFRTASLCALFIGENPSRANELSGFAMLALDRTTGINIKGKQSMVTRRRPFMSAYKNRGI